MARKFKAEVQQLLNLMIHSVYSEREVFLRELVSNAADALDKARFLGVTRQDLVAIEGDEPGIRVLLDEEAHTITIEDDGIGLTKDEAISNLGTIARSGTGAFLEKLQQDGANLPDLIGQFGVGFYSSFMVADKVVVETRSALPDAEGVTWTSRGEGTYDLGDLLQAHRGTRVILHLRDDAWDEFGNATKLREIIRKHSNFLPWPILLDGEQANEGKALWRKRPTEVSDDEANQFYKTVSMDWADPALRVHLSVDSPFQYHALLFVPKQRPYNLFDPYADRGPRLYAKRVLILEHAAELLPEWLRFVRGVVDSEDISLNISREMMQKTAVVRKIRDALTKRVLKEMNEFAVSTPPEADGDSDGDGDEAPHTYADMWANYGKVLKEGYYHSNTKWGELLLPLLRFNALSHDDENGQISLQQYVDNMPEDQDAIWFLTGESRSSCLSSPHLEGIRQKGWDVLLLTDPVDEWLITVLTSYADYELKSVSRGEIDLGEEEDEEEGGERADLTGLAPWLDELLGDKVTGVRSSTRLTDSACVLVDDESGLSANMERILRAANQEVDAMSRRILELNPRHPLIKNLAKLHDAGHTDIVEPMAHLLYDDALLLEGTVREPAAMGRRLQSLLEQFAESKAATAS